MYAIRRVQDAFKENKGLEDIDLLAKQFEFAKKNLGVIKRQVSKRKTMCVMSLLSNYISYLIYSEVLVRCKHTINIFRSQYFM